MTALARRRQNELLAYSYHDKDKFIHGRSAASAPRARPSNASPLSPALDYNRGPAHRLEGLAQALDPRVHFVGGAEIEDQHMVVSAMDHLFEAARQFGATADG
jgi:hypothetical protein